MHIKLIIFLSALFTSIASQAELIFKYEKERFYDKSWFENGKQIIERHATLISHNGKEYHTQQRFIVIDRSTIEYIPHSSSLNTLKYIKENCAKDGMVPAPEPILGMGYMRISMTSAFGMICVSRKNLDSTLH